jgi:CubicO group peptidase (beta-lactamase class C family)
VLDWPVGHVAAAVVGPEGVRATAGETERVFKLASVTKPLAAYAVLVAVEEGAVEWDMPAGPEGSTVRHLAAHTSGLSFSDGVVQAKPGARRIYSNVGFEVLGETVAAGAGMPFDRYLHEAVLARFAIELLAPTLVHRETLDEATTVAFPGVDGVLPGYGRQKPNDWGLGFEIRDGKSPHWTGANSSPRTFGHFGQSGTFLWVDPVVDAACLALTDRNFGPWAIEAWPPYTDGVLAAL